MNIALFVGMFKGNENLLNVAIFIMWIMAMFHVIAMFQSNEDLLKTKGNWYYRAIARTLTFITIFHSVYWGYIFVPTVWFIAAVVIWARRHTLEESLKRPY